MSMMDDAFTRFSDSFWLICLDGLANSKSRLKYLHPHIPGHAIEGAANVSKIKQRFPQFDEAKERALVYAEEDLGSPRDLLITNKFIYVQDCPRTSIDHPECYIEERPNITIWFHGRRYGINFGIFIFNGFTTGSFGIGREPDASLLGYFLDRILTKDLGLREAEILGLANLSDSIKGFMTSPLRKALGSYIEIVGGRFYATTSPDEEILFSVENHVLTNKRLICGLSGQFPLSHGGECVVRELLGRENAEPSHGPIHGVIKHPLHEFLKALFEQVVYWVNNPIVKLGYELKLSSQTRSLTTHLMCFPMREPQFVELITRLRQSGIKVVFDADHPEHV